MDMYTRKKHIAQHKAFASKPAPTGIFSGRGTQCAIDNIRKIALHCLQSGDLPEITDGGVQSRFYTLC
jgi:hypothetical protein